MRHETEIMASLDGAPLIQDASTSYASTHVWDWGPQSLGVARQLQKASLAAAGRSMPESTDGMDMCRSTPHSNDWK